MCGAFINGGYVPAIPILTVLMIWANRFCKVAMAKSKGNLAAYKAVSEKVMCSCNTASTFGPWAHCYPW